MTIIAKRLLDITLLFVSTFIVNHISFGQYQYQLNIDIDKSIKVNKLYLQVETAYPMGKFHTIDSAIIKDNTVRFGGIINQPVQNAYIYTKGFKSFVYFVLDSGVNKMKIEPVNLKGPFWKNILSNSRMLHSESNDIFFQIKKLNFTYYAKYGNNLSDSLRRALNNEQFSVIKDHPKAYYSLIFLYEYSRSKSFNSVNVFNILGSLDTSIQQLSLAVKVRNELQAEENVRVGANISKFTSRTNDDQYFTNDILIGRAYLIAFGATWCVPCEANIPMLQELYSKYHLNDFEIVFVNLDQEVQLWKNRIQKRGLSWINISDLTKWEENKFVKSFNIKAIPYYILVDKEGKIVYNSIQSRDKDFSILSKSIAETVKNN